MLASPLLRPVKERSTFEETFERLATAIRLGVVEQGERLPSERDLAAQLNVSRMTLRDALQALAQAGYLETRRGRSGGTVVVYDPQKRRTRTLGIVAEDLGSAEVLDALAYRSIVEPGAAELAARRQLSDDDRRRLVDAHDAVVRTTDRASHRIADSRLHLLLAELCGSASIAAAVAEIQGRIDELLAAIPVFDRNIAHSNAQHAAIVEAVLAGQPDRARTAMATHLEATAALLRGLLA
jgi:GntR family transcriptional repressor for pyruvate dehydrogenase complex